MDLLPFLWEMVDDPQNLLFVDIVELSMQDKKYEDIIMPKSRTDHVLENEIHNAFRNEYILTLEQKGLITIIKRLDANYPINTNDVRITDYGNLLVEAIYDEEFFGKINIR